MQSETTTAVDARHHRLKRVAELLRVLWLTAGLLWTSARRQLAVFFILQVVTTAAATATLLVVRIMFGMAQGPTPTTQAAQVLAIAGLLAVVLAVSSVSLTLQRNVITTMSEYAGMHALEHVLDVAAACPLDAFDSADFHGRLQRAQNTSQRPVELAQALLAIGQAAATAVALVGVLIVIQPELVLIAVTSAVPILVTSAAASRRLFVAAVSMVRMDMARRYVCQLLTSRSSAKEVRLFEMASFLREKNRSLFEQRMTILRRTMRKNAITAGAGGALTGTGIAASAAFLVTAVGSGRVSVASAATAVAALVQLNALLTAISANVSQVYSNALFFDDYQIFCHEARALQRVPASALPSVKTLDHIELRNVSFRYRDGRRPALDDVSIDIRRGEVVALVGPNGSGKTTLAKVLCGLYQPSDGSVVCDGSVIDESSAVAYRNRIAVVFQDFGRYQFTLAENISFSVDNDGPARRRVVDAATLSGVQSFVPSLPLGYDTELSRELTDGTDLSGGQWQQVALARAFYRNAPLVILDEPTASLDAMAEERLFETIRTMFLGRAVLLISHRFSTVRSADRVYVLERGRLTETGTHDSLLAHGGTYAQMYNLQAAPYLASAK